MRTFNRIYVNFAFAKRTYLCCWSGRCLLLFFFADRHHLINGFNDKEDDERHNYKVDYSGNECAVINIIIANKMNFTLNFGSAYAIDERIDNVICKRGNN